MPFYAYSAENPLYSRAATKRSSVRFAVGWITGTVIRNRFIAGPIMLWSASIAAGHSRAMGMPIGNSVVGPAMTSIESEESGMMSKHTQKEIERMRMDG